MRFDSQAPAVLSENMTVHTDMQAYYAQRAASYEEVYAKPERQADLAWLHGRLRGMFAGQRVLEIACGTGYWTADLIALSTHVLSIDLTPEVLTLARAKGLPEQKVNFALADAFNFSANREATACFAGFWWSHVGREHQASFLDRLKLILAPNAQLVLVDNVYVEGNSTPIARTDAHGNTYQIRRLPNDERYEVLKNFPTDSTLRKRFGRHLKELRIQRLDYYWLLSGRFK
ncbi:MAG: hypothetical protein NVSMB6_10100 [Burkholderiaceae bacterium]